MAAIGETEWFFYVPRDRKYRNGDRPNRVTASGYWKATGADRMIRAENNMPIGLKKTLVFYSGKAPKGVRSSWIMNEYRLPPEDTDRYHKVRTSSESCDPQLVARETRDNLQGIERRIRELGFGFACLELVVVAKFRFWSIQFQLCPYLLGLGAIIRVCSSSLFCILAAIRIYTSLLSRCYHIVHENVLDSTILDIISQICTEFLWETSFAESSSSF
jgi:hypothetical protein